MALLSLFIKIQYRMTNLIVGVITRESVRMALVNGISSQEIIAFLVINAHPEARKRYELIS